MKLSIMIGALIMLAWPFYDLYQHQLGAIPFLLLAIFFFVVYLKQLKKLKKEKLSKNNRKN